MLAIGSHSWQTTTMLPYGDSTQNRKLIHDSVDEAVKNCKIEGQIINSEAGGDIAHLDLQRIGFVPAYEQTAVGRTNIDIAIHHTGDRLVSFDTSNRVSNQQLVARRHRTGPNSGQSGHKAYPGAGRIHHY